MTNAELIHALRECGVPQEIEIRDDSLLQEDLLLSSFSLMMLLVRMEDLLHKTINPLRFADVKTVADLRKLEDIPAVDDTNVSNPPWGGVP